LVHKTKGNPMSDWSGFEFIKCDIQGETLVVTINRPEVYNALNKAGKAEIVKAIRIGNKDEAIRSIILTAEGKAFCSGQDLNDRSVQGKEGKKVDLGHTLETEWNPLINAIRESKKLVVGAINGVAAGAGLSVAMACDMIVAAPKVKFVSGFSQLGLAPDAGSSFTFVKGMGYSKTLEFFLFNEALYSEDLYGWGMINRVSDNPLREALTMTQKINKMAPLSLELIKKNLQEASERDFASVMARETATQRFLGASNDYQEGLEAFFEKRKPQFSGS
jgi:2-(1,2-epoxy-1,2-dihydrophenyl)acetyl-CoA isomerase